MISHQWSSGEENVGNLTQAEESLEDLSLDLAEIEQNCSFLREINQGELRGNFAPYNKIHVTALTVLILSHQRWAEWAFRESSRQMLAMNKMKESAAVGNFNCSYKSDVIQLKAATCLGGQIACNPKNISLRAACFKIANSNWPTKAPQELSKGCMQCCLIECNNVLIEWQPVKGVDNLIHDGADVGIGEANRFERIITWPLASQCITDNVRWFEWDPISRQRNVLSLYLPRLCYMCYLSLSYQQPQ